MRISPPKVEIGELEGFSPDKDLFKRAAIGKSLQGFILRVEEPVVIAVDGQWGSGKTTFLKMFAGELRKDGFPVVYFDAFQNDYLDDAFTAIASEIVAMANELVDRV